MLYQPLLRSLCSEPPSGRGDPLAGGVPGYSTIVAAFLPGILELTFLVATFKVNPIVAAFKVNKKNPKELTFKYDQKHEQELTFKEQELTFLVAAFLPGILELTFKEQELTLLELTYM